MEIKTKCPECGEADVLDYDGGDSGNAFDPALPEQLGCFGCGWTTQDESEIIQYIPSKEN